MGREEKDFIEMSVRVIWGFGGILSVEGSLGILDVEGRMGNMGIPYS